MFTVVIGYPRNYQIRVIKLIRGSNILSIKKKIQVTIQNLDNSGKITDLYWRNIFKIQDSSINLEKVHLHDDITGHAVDLSYSPYHNLLSTTVIPKKIKDIP